MNDGNVEARNLGDDRVLWSVPLVAPELSGTDNEASPTNLDLVEIAPNGKFVLSYEASAAYDATGLAKGTLVIRRTADGAVEALYDVARVSDLAIAPDSKTFVYSTAVGPILYGRRARAVLGSRCAKCRAFSIRARRSTEPAQENSRCRASRRRFGRRSFEPRDLPLPRLGCVADQEFPGGLSCSGLARVRG